MSLEIRNTKELIDPANLKLKILIYGLAGTGKTAWLSTVPGIGIAACETGLGSGLLTVADKDISFCVPSSYAEFEAIASGKVFGDKEAIGLDSLTEMVNTFVKERSLALPRARGESDKRKLGVPELDDYGTMGELTRRLLRKLIDSTPTQHVIVTATERIDKPDPENGDRKSVV